MQPAPEERRRFWLRVSNNPQMIQGILLDYLHARKCQRIEDEACGEKWPCTVPTCNEMKRVLRHISTCRRAAHTCKEIRHCHFLRLYFRHWEVCTSSDCPVCSDMKVIETEWRAQQFVTSNVEQATAETATDQPPNSTIDLASIQQEINGLSETDQLSGIVHDESMLSPTPAQVVKEWHRSVPPELRKRVIEKMVQATNPPSSRYDKGMQQLCSCIKKFEHNRYEQNNTKEKYCEEVAVGILEIKKYLKRRRYERKQLRLQHQQLQQRYHQQLDMLVHRLHGLL